ncbi:hypothetical protein GMLC_08780 [Geomonas limicola]|uniref:Lipoprotein n=1 Tax=Geomonas limicola TaxID=2740186 RepID=A0A6V8N7L9_9BACT|nr:hypothetical protein [Geomonas limicola]GFO67299.1 hypothetical protein GMLC_08780 [Geomonas limicola]
MALRLALFLALLTAFGCASRVPVAVNHSLTTQKKAKAAHHWDVLAEDIAQQTKLAIADPKKNFPKKPIYIQPGGSSSFDTAFRNFLITRMVNDGVPVTAEPREGLAIGYDTQLVRHDSSRYTHIPGSLTALAAGVWVIRDLAAGAAADAAPATLGLTALADYALGHYAGGATHTELIVTTTILDQSRYIFRKSDIYYLEDEDTGLFSGEAPARQVKQLGVVAQ